MNVTHISYWRWERNGRQCDDHHGVPTSIVVITDNLDRTEYALNGIKRMRIVVDGHYTMRQQRPFWHSPDSAEFRGTGKLRDISNESGAFTQVTVVLKDRNAPLNSQGAPSTATINFYARTGAVLHLYPLATN